LGVFPRRVFVVGDLDWHYFAKSSRSSSSQEEKGQKEEEGVPLQ